MSEKPGVRRSRTSLSETAGRTDWSRVAAMTDDDIDRATRDDPDWAGADVDWSTAEIVIPPPKRALSIRLDDDVLAFFRSGGPGYQTRINAVLRAYMRAQRG